MKGGLNLTCILMAASSAVRSNTIQVIVWSVSESLRRIGDDASSGIHSRGVDMMDCSIHPFRIVVFGTAEVTKGKGRRARVVRQGFGYDLWNPDEETSERAGRPGFGSFYWFGLSVARRAALDALQQPGIDQVQIRTNQDNRVFTFYRSQWGEYVRQTRLPLAA